MKSEIIENRAGTLNLTLLVRSYISFPVSQVRAESESSRCVFAPNPKGQILDFQGYFLHDFGFYGRRWVLSEMLESVSFHAKHHRIPELRCVH